ncbi:MAG: ATP-binding protein [Bacillota bacterium]
MQKSWRQWFLTDVKRAIKDYGMISPGDEVAVGVSGGKDSMALLYVLAYLRDYSHLSFSLKAVYVDAGWGTTDYSPVEAFCAAKGVPLHTVKYPIAQIIAEKKEKSACSLCSKLRAGLLNSRAKELGCNRVALGHHLDDAIETFFLNLLYAGSIKTFRPAVYLDRIGLYLIRPFSYLPERTLAALAVQEGIPVIPAACPYAGKTKRESMKDVVRCITERYPEFRARFRSALENVSFRDLWRQRRGKPCCLVSIEEERLNGGVNGDRNHHRDDSGQGDR